MEILTRRRFIQTLAASSFGCVAGPGPVTAMASGPKLVLSPPTVISGDPRERGRLYGSQFGGPMKAFLQEVLDRNVGKPASKDELLRFAGACGDSTRTYSPTIHEELEGMAEGADLRLEEVFLLTLDEELRRRQLPYVQHCTAVAAGPPDTLNGHTFVTQTWDWPTSRAGLGYMLCWRRPEGPSLLAYSYPGLWIGAGMNSAGLGLTWVSVTPKPEDHGGPAIGLPSYVLVAHLLYQSKFEDVMREMRRVPRAGWFEFVVGDARGNLACFEASPTELGVQVGRGWIARDGPFRIPKMWTASTSNLLNRVAALGHYEHATALLQQGVGKIDAAYIERMFEEPDNGICLNTNFGATLDMMIFDVTAREAYVSRGPLYGVDWKRFTFPS
jgi:hypothetical protein